MNASVKEQTPEERATAAAEALAAEGLTITARSVRDRSDVRMAVASDAAHEWNEQESKDEDVPEAPAAVQARFAALWREAVTVARAEFAEARAGRETRIAKAIEDSDAMAEDLGKVEDERDKALRKASDAEKEVTAQRSRADKAEGKAETIAGERDQLIGERDGLLTCSKTARRKTGNAGSCWPTPPPSTPSRPTTPALPDRPPWPET